MMPIHLDAQQWDLLDSIPCERDIEDLLNHLMANLAVERDYSCTVRLVDATESAEYNERYRNKSGPTNVLSFPYEEFPGVETDLLGDLLICAPVVAREAEEQNKAVEAHFSHMVIHGVLHLLGYDHETSEQANQMERLEIEVLRQNGYPDPYQLTDSTE